MSYKDAVILVPGFLGFEHIGYFRYFASRVGATLRGFLTALSDRPIPVVAVHTRPTDHLQARQLALLNGLRWADRQLGHVEQLHLVGHSTGGVDAYLLTRGRPLGAPERWAELDPEGLRHKIRSVVTIGSPHAGTCLALSPLAQAFHKPQSSLQHGPRLTRSMWRLGKSLWADEMAVSAFYSAVLDTGSAAAYVLDIMRSRTLVDDLRPRRMLQVQEHTGRGLPVRVRAVVTMAGACTRAYVGASGVAEDREPDDFFKDLFTYAAGSGYDEVDDDRPRIERSLARIRQVLDAGEEIANPQTVKRPLDAQLNDGLVNAARQLADPDDPQELLAVVIGDHVDVMGYYPQWVPAGAPQKGREKRAQLRSGILHSGSGFSDDQFFALFAKVAQAIHGAARP